MAQQTIPEGNHSESFAKMMRGITANLVDDPGEDSSISGSEISMAAFGFVKPNDTGGKSRHNKAMEYVPRHELDAKLDAIRADMRASQAELRSDFAGMRTVFAESQKGTIEAMAKVSEGVAELRGEVKGINGGLSGLGGHIDGIKTSVTMLQWVIGIVGAAAAIWIGYQQLSAAEKATTQPTPPTVIYVQPPAATINPQAPPAPEANTQPSANTGN